MRRGAQRQTAREGRVPDQARARRDLCTAPLSAKKRAMSAVRFLITPSAPRSERSTRQRFRPIAVDPKKLGSVSHRARLALARGSALHVTLKLKRGLPIAWAQALQRDRCGLSQICQGQRLSVMQMAVMFPNCLRFHRSSLARANQVCLLLRQQDHFGDTRWLQ
jgi:hypothetical protein